MVAVENHVHALEHEAPILILEGKNALAAQDVRAFLLHQILDPREKFVCVERLVGFERNRLHFLVVVVLEPAMMVVVMVVIMVVIMVMIVMMVMIVIMVLAFEEVRFDIENAVEIEGAAFEHLVERDLRALGPVHLRVGLMPRMRASTSRARRARRDRSC